MRYKSNFHIYLDNVTVNGSTVTHNRTDIVDFVKDYRFQAGPTQPIRYLEMQVNKNDIDAYDPDLINSIVEGRTRLVIQAVDGGTFIISKIWLDDYLYDIVATGIEVTLNTATLASDIAKGQPVTVAQTIFNSWKNDLKLDSEIGDDFVFYKSSNFGNSPNTIGFSEDMPSMVAIQLCALMDGATVFFATNPSTGKNTLYYVSYDDILPLASNPANTEMDGVIHIYPKMNSVYTNYSTFDVMMFKKCIGLAFKEGEGADTIINNQIVSATGGKGSASSSESIALYGDYAGAEVTSEYILTSNAGCTQIASAIVERYKDPTRSISITLSEAETDDTGTAWECAIDPFSYANKIVDDVNNITLENIHLCDSEENNQVLALSSFIRKYPEMTTEYTFGVTKDTTLASELATTLNGGSGAVSDVKCNGSSILVNRILTVDYNITQNSNNPIRSGAVYAKFATVDQNITDLTNALNTLDSNVVKKSGTTGTVDLSGCTLKFNDTNWQPSGNIVLNATADGSEWSFDIYRGDYANCVWHVWDNNLSSILSVTSYKDSSSNAQAKVTVRNNDQYSVAQVRNVIISTSSPSGGSNGDIWIRYS